MLTHAIHKDLSWLSKSHSNFKPQALFQAVKYRTPNPSPPSDFGRRTRLHLTLQHPEFHRCPLPQESFKLALHCTNDFLWENKSWTPKLTYEWITDWISWSRLAYESFFTAQQLILRVIFSIEGLQLLSKSLPDTYGMPRYLTGSCPSLNKLSRASSWASSIDRPPQYTSVFAGFDFNLNIT